MFRTHFVLSLFLGLLFMELFSYGWVFLLIVVLVGVLPDIDHPKSFIGKRLRGLSDFISFIFGHRGFFHSIFIVLVIVLVLDYFMLSEYSVAFSLGYLSHLVGDMFTRSGVAFLYPFSEFKIKGIVKVDGFLEEVLFVLLVLGCLWLIWGIV